MLDCAGDKDHAPQEIRLPPLQLLVKADPVEFRHAEIAEDEVVGLVLDLFEGNPTVDGHVDLIPFGGQRVGYRLSDEGPEPVAASSAGRDDLSSLQPILSP